MRMLRREIVNDRRVSLVEHEDRRYTITIEVCVREDSWEDISLRADQDLAFDAASRRYRQRVIEQQARALGLNV